MTIEGGWSCMESHGLINRTLVYATSPFPWEGACLPGVRFCGVPGSRGAFATIETVRPGSVAGDLNNRKMLQCSLFIRNVCYKSSHG
jgi:hypothetical protein